jgi:hypothetical protein
MQTIRVLERTGKDGTLHLCIPLGKPEADFEVVVVVQPKEPAPPMNTAHPRPVLSAHDSSPPAVVARPAAATRPPGP